MGRTNIVFTGWQHKPHLIDEQSLEVGLEQRLRDAGVENRVPDIAVYGPIGHPAPKPAKPSAKEPNTKPAEHSFEALVLSVQPGFHCGVLEAGVEAKQIGYRCGGIAHALELAEFHPISLAPFRTIVCVADARLDVTGQLIVPVLTNAGTDQEPIRFLEERTFPSATARVLNGKSQMGFILLQSLWYLSGTLSCRQCPVPPPPKPAPTSCPA